ncbi:MAG: DUF4417 domain-containing protein [Lachnospiraceae bacterium]|nr:DUF4417 domain-containing protein [Lachnospiraceae bacterium]
MNFRDRGLDNLGKMLVPGVGKYNIPQMEPIDIGPPYNMIRINEARHFPMPSQVGIQFYAYDYQILRLWERPDFYMETFRKFRFMLTPDFSMYTDWPLAVNIYNHYRKHWLGAYWQKHGMRIIPTIGWSDEASYEWCFDGDPVGGMVSVSSVGTQNDETAKRLFLSGFKEMLVRLRPSGVLFYGDIPKELSGCDIIIHVEPFQKQLRQFDKNRT